MIPGLGPRVPRAGGAPRRSRAMEPDRSRVVRRGGVRRQEGLIAAEGPLVCRTGSTQGARRTTIIVREPSSEKDIAWGGPNREMSAEHFARFAAISSHRSRARTSSFRTAAPAGSEVPPAIASSRLTHGTASCPEPVHRGCHAGCRPAPALDDHRCPGLQGRSRPLHGTNSEVVICDQLRRTLVLIGGTSYAGEIKKSSSAR